MKERMKVYFKLNALFQRCMKTCPQKDSHQKVSCDQLCSKVYDEYVESLKERYKENPGKIDEVVQNSPLSKTTKKPFTNSLWYKITNNAEHYNNQGENK